MYFSSRKYICFLQKIPPDAVDSPGSHTRIAILLATYLLYLFRPLIATDVSQYYLRHIYFIFLDRLLQQKK